MTLGMRHIVSRSKLCIVALVSFVLFACNMQKEVPEIYNGYRAFVQNNLKQMHDSNLQKRTKLIEDLVSTETYRVLIKRKRVEEKYLLILHYISQKIANSNNVDIYKTDVYLYAQFCYSDMGEDQYRFIHNLTQLERAEEFGGWTDEVILLFDRYKEKFGFLGKEVYTKDLNDSPNLHDVISYDISNLFAVITPYEKDVLDAIYRSKVEGVSSWIPNKSRKIYYGDKYENYNYPHLLFEEEYYLYLNKHYSSSPNYKRLNYVRYIDLIESFHNDVNLATELYLNEHVVVTCSTGDFKEIEKNSIILNNKYGNTIDCHFAEIKKKVAKELMEGNKYGYYRRVEFLGQLKRNENNESLYMDACKFW